LSLPPDTKILACRVFTPELLALGLSEDQVNWLDQGLHLYPDKLREEITTALAEMEADPACQQVILVYGYCGGGLEGITSRRVRLVVPVAHDCIPLLMGLDTPASPSTRTFYFSAGWIDYGRNPQVEYQDAAERFGEAIAMRISKEIFKSYEDFALIDNGCTQDQRFWQFTQDCARLYGKDCCQVSGTLESLRRLLAGEPSPQVRVYEPGQAIHLQDFQSRQKPQLANSQEDLSPQVS
jgi:hypothetical protein